jgi:hypothetical protein
MGSWEHNSKGFTLITTLMLLFLLSGLAIGMLMMVNTEVKVGTQDVQNNVTFHAAEGAIEKMTADLANTLQTTLSPSVTDITNLASSPGPPVLSGITFPNPGVAYPNGGYTYTPVLCTGANTPAPNCTADNIGALAITPGAVPSGNFAGLNALLMNVQLQATAQGLLGDEVSMVRTVEVAFIPVFQFGIFCDGDCGFFAGPNFNFGGRVHANGDLYLAEGAGDTLTFQSKVSAYGNVVRQVLSNGNTIGSNSSTGTVLIPTAASGCSGAQPACVAMTPTEGSVVLGPTSAYNSGPPSWQTISLTDYNGYVIDGDNGNTNLGTGATDLTLPFVNGANSNCAAGAPPCGPQNYEIIRRPPGGESPSSPLGASRLYNLAQIRVLLSDNPDELPCGNPSAAPATGCGSTDSQNVRLANVQDTDNGLNYSQGVPQTNMAKLADGDYPSLYFATANSATPNPSTGFYEYPGATQVSTDWEFGPLTPYPSYTINGNVIKAETIYVAPGNSLVNTVGNSPAIPPYVLMDTSATSAAITKTPPPDNLVLCNPSGVSTQTTTTTTATQPSSPPNPPYCPSTGSYPYYSLAVPVTGTSGNPALTLPYPNPGGGSAAAITTSNASQSAWNLLDGYLRVEYQDNNGNYHPVTQEWLGLGFARGLQPPTAIGGNTMSPNAILILQQPADRSGNGTVDSTGAPPSYSYPTPTSKKSGSTYTWTYTYTAVPGKPPEVVVDSNTNSPYFGDSKQAGGLQSPSQYSWYPINFYDPREGEVRDVTPGNANSCTPNGVMSAVELDVGNLQQWLAGKIGVSGGSVNSSNQNGYILYFSDRRGMLPNPNGSPVDPANTKTGDAGLEDDVNSASATGTPNGTLDPDGPGKTYSPEDVNLNGKLDNWGAANLGLGLGYNLTLPVAATTTYTVANNINKVVNSPANPDPYMTATANRISSCAVAQGNWISGARHVIKLVDGSLGNLPLMPGGGGGFSVASENPVYVLGNYNSNAGDTTWTTGKDEAGMAAAGIIADTVTLLSGNWQDWNSILLSPTNQANRTAQTTYYRMATAAGKNINFPYPGNGTANDFGTDGGVHNFLRYIENWGGFTLNYEGSIGNLYYSTYNTGIYKCCNLVYSPPSRNYLFDNDFTLPSGLPPGTPTFRDIDNLSYRQSFTPCTVAANGLCTN